MELDKTTTARWLISVDRLARAEGQAIAWQLSNRKAIPGSLALRIQRLRVLSLTLLQRLIGVGEDVAAPPCPVTGCANTGHARCHGPASLAR